MIDTKCVSFRGLLLGAYVISVVLKGIQSECFIYSNSWFRWKNDQIDWHKLFHKWWYFLYWIFFFMASIFPVSHFLCMNYTKIFTAHYIADFLSWLWLSAFQRLVTLVWNEKFLSNESMLWGFCSPSNYWLIAKFLIFS